MARGPVRASHRLSTVLACVLTAGLVAGVALASPRAFDRVVQQAKHAVMGGDEGDERTGRGRDPGGEGASGSPASDGCSAIVEAYRQAAPPSDDASALHHAIDVVSANCEKNPQASGLIRALQRLATNAERQAERAGHGGGNGNGHGGSGENGPPANAHAGGNGSSKGNGG